MKDVPNQYRQLSSYILAQTIDAPTLQRRQALYVASQEEPDVICGIARRVGSTGVCLHDLVMYRLLIQTSTRSRKMLPALFVLDQGIFYEYEQWQLLIVGTKDHGSQECA